MKAFDNILKQIKAYQEEVKNGNGDPGVIAYLHQVGKETIRIAADTKSTGNISLNQLNAYGWGVYYNGKLVKRGLPEGAAYRTDHDPHKTTNQKGRGMAMRKIQNYKPADMGYVLYIINAMFYSAIQETQSYLILTQALAEAQAKVHDQFGVDVRIDIQREWIK